MRADTLIIKTCKIGLRRERCRLCHLVNRQGKSGFTFMVLRTLLFSSSGDRAREIGFHFLWCCVPLCFLLPEIGQGKSGFTFMTLRDPFVFSSEEQAREIGFHFYDSVKSFVFPSGDRAREIGFHFYCFL